jgi:hypothetical protein
MNPSLNSKRSWRILSWNIRGINSEGKWDAIRNKIAESGCDIICLQETKREFFDSNTLEISALHHLIALNLFTRLGHLGAVSSFGKLIILWVPWPSKIALDSLLNWFADSQESTGF